MSEDALARIWSRRRFVQTASAGTVVAFLGSLWVLTDEALAEPRRDGRSRVPPGQRVIKRLKAMGGDAGDPSPGAFRLRVHGEVERPFTLTLAALLKMKQSELALDVHCVTGWTALGLRFGGVRVRELIERAGPKKSARHVIFEAAHGYTSNVPLRQALRPEVVVAHELEGRPLPRAHGAPVRAVVPDLYFWKSAKWLTGIKLVRRDEPGYWERRGYNNHADPWKEQRYA